jgi:hypothetical protein
MPACEALACRSKAVFRRGIWQLARSGRDVLPGQRGHAMGNEHGAGYAEPWKSGMDIVSPGVRITVGSALQVGAGERGEIGLDPDSTRMDGRPAVPCLLFQMSRAQRCRRVGPTVEEGMA